MPRFDCRAYGLGHAMRVAVPAATLAMAAPACTGAVRDAPAASVLERHAFRSRDGIMILDVRIGDSAPMPFVLDTGASPCVIDPLDAERLAITATKATERRGGAGIFKSGVADRPVTLAIGAKALACSETLITDLSGITELMGVRIAGLIGGDFFRNRVVEIDYDRATVTVHDRRLYQRRRDGAVLPIRIERNRPYLQARLSVQDGPQDVQRELLIDSGSLDKVDDPILKESRTPPRPVANAVGLGSGATISEGMFNKVEIGPYSFESVNGAVPSVAIVGNGLLTKFNLVFDYDGGWLMLRPRG